MVNVIGRFDAVINLNHAPDKANDVGLGNGAVRDGNVEVEFLVQFVTPHPLEVVMPLVEQLLFEERAGIIQRGRVAGPHLLEEFNQRGLGHRQPAAQIPFRLLAQGGGNKQAVGVIIDILEERDDFFVRPDREDVIGAAITDSRQGAQEDGNRHGALAVELQDDVVVFAGLELHPRAAVRNQFGHRQGASGGAVGGSLEIDARRTNQLRNDNALRSIDDERAFVGHLREIAQEDILLDGFGNIRPSQQHRNIERAGIGQVALDALFDGMLGVAKPILQAPFLRLRAAAGEIQFHALVIRLDGRDLVEQIAETFALEALEGIQLHLDEIGQAEVDRDARVIFPGECGSH